MSRAGAFAVTPPPAGVSVLAPAEGGTPSSNHGVKSHGREEPRVHARGEGCGVWDYLTLTVDRAALKSKNEQGDVERYAHGARTLEDAKALPTDFLDWLLPGHALTPGPFFDPKGWQGYKQSCAIHAPGIATPVGIIAREGNRDTVCISITGSGMFAVNLARARLALEHYGARLTRLDAAFDDLEGVCVPLSELRYEASIGLFDASRRPSARSYVDDLGTNTGCSLYVGRKGDKQYNAYEKGKQQGDEHSPWIRHEVRMWAKNRHLPLSMIEAGPMAMILGAYPRLAAYLPSAAPSRAKTMRRQVEAKAGAMFSWIRSAAGKSLGLGWAAAQQAGVTPEEFLAYITRDGMPSRFNALPDEVAQYRTAEFLQDAISAVPA